MYDRLVIVFAVIAILVASVACIRIIQRSDDCRKKGGIIVRTQISYVCAKIQEIK